jgi:hypothetical protein
MHVLIPDDHFEREDFEFAPRDNQNDRKICILSRFQILSVQMSVLGSSIRLDELDLASTGPGLHTKPTFNRI